MLRQIVSPPIAAIAATSLTHGSFPMFVGGRKAVKTAHKQKEHIPGLPARIHFRLGGTNYPVEDRICEISCRAKGVDNILANGSDAMDICLKGCKKAPVGVPTRVW